MQWDQDQLMSCKIDQDWEKKMKMKGNKTNREKGWGRNNTTDKDVINAAATDVAKNEE